MNSLTFACSFLCLRFLLLVPSELKLPLGEAEEDVELEEDGLSPGEPPGWRRRRWVECRLDFLSLLSAGLLLDDEELDEEGDEGGLSPL